MDKLEKEWLKRNKAALAKEGKIYDEKTGQIIISEQGYVRGGGKKNTSPKRATNKPTGKKK